MEPGQEIRTCARRPTDLRDPVERLAACVALCDDFHGGPFEEAVAVIGEIDASPRPETTAA